MEGLQSDSSEFKKSIPQTLDTLIQLQEKKVISREQYLELNKVLNGLTSLETKTNTEKFIIEKLSKLKGDPEKIKVFFDKFMTRVADYTAVLTSSTSGEKIEQSIKNNLGIIE